MCAVEGTRTAYQTPCYIIHKEKLQQNIRALYEPFLRCWGQNFLMGYSVKTNHLPWLIQYAFEQGLWIETVSDDELYLAQNCMISGKKIILNGPQKRKEGISYALDKGSIINIDNFEEIDILSELLKSKKNSGRAIIGLRVNFDLEAVCRGETTAGQSVSRFGFCVENGDFQRAVNKLHQLGLLVKGLHMHYSSITRSSLIFANLAQEACKAAKGSGILSEIQYIDMGGGFFGGRVLENYPTPTQYAETITSVLKTHFNPDKVSLIIEPGAAILASALDYRCKVINTRQVRETRIVTTDGSTLHINPFQVKRTPTYRIQFKGKKDKGDKQIVCGNTCMENDRFFETEDENVLNVGDELTFLYTGAYTQSFNNCFINLPPAVYMVDEKNEIHLVRLPIRELMSYC